MPAIAVKEYVAWRRAGMDLWTLDGRDMKAYAAGHIHGSLRPEAAPQAASGRVVWISQDGKAPTCSSAAALWLEGGIDTWPGPLDSECGRIYPEAYGLFFQLVAAGAFFAAHEVLEGLWRAIGDDLLKGLIQAAVAMHHVSRGNLVGAKKVLARAMWYLEEDTAALGFDVPLEGLRRWLTAWQTRLAHLMGAYTWPPSPIALWPGPGGPWRGEIAQMWMLVHRISVSVEHIPKLQAALQLLQRSLAREPGFLGVEILHQGEQFVVLSRWASRHDLVQWQEANPKRDLADGLRTRSVVTEVYEVLA